jgi:uncharacterized membrane protein
MILLVIYHLQIDTKYFPFPQDILFWVTTQIGFICLSKIFLVRLTQPTNAANALFTVTIKNMADRRHIRRKPAIRHNPQILVYLY